MEDNTHLLALTCVEPEREPDSPHLKRLQPGRRIDELGDDPFGFGRGHLLDVHAARRGRHERNLAPAAIDEEAQIQLARDVGCRFDQDGGDRLALGRRLSRHEPGSEHRLRQGRDLVGGTRPPDSARLSAPARVDLRLDHPRVSPQRFSRRARLRGARRGAARGHRDTVGREERLGLELVEVHEAGSTGCGLGVARTGETSRAPRVVPHRALEIEAQARITATGAERGRSG